MKINSINNVNTDVIKKQSAVKQTTGQNEIKQINSLTMAYPQNYYVSFAGGRNTQKAYDDFKDTEMPTTVRNFIENEELLSSPEDIKVLKDNGLKYIHRLAYSSLPDCKTIDDIKKAYPHDKAFKNLKSVREIENTTFGPIMKELDEKYNGVYGWTKNAGYFTKAHREAVLKHGLVEGIHRRSWATYAEMEKELKK